MIIAPVPGDEVQRLAALWALGLLDSPPEAMFDRLVRVAQQVTGQMTAAISLVDQQRQWFKAIVGLDAKETPRDVAFCAHTILGEHLNVLDTHADPRFFDNPLVLGPPYIRAYYGRTVRAPQGEAIGTLCVFGPTPGVPEEDQLRALGDLAKVTEEVIRLRCGWSLLQGR
jgi:GAF domain-containing protein